jgi:hypothetical protein
MSGLVETVHGIGSEFLFFTRIEFVLYLTPVTVIEKVHPIEHESVSITLLGIKPVLQTSSDERVSVPRLVRQMLFECGVLLYLTKPTAIFTGPSNKASLKDSRLSFRDFTKTTRPSYEEIPKRAVKKFLDSTPMGYIFCLRRRSEELDRVVGDVDNAMPTFL